MVCWNEPLPFIVCDNRKKLLFDERVKEKIEEIDKSLCIVCCAGPMREGKSYLLNRLAGKQMGFPLGSTVESKTKGIWAWYIDHPKDKTKGILLLDTEGLLDPKNGDKNYDLKVLSLSLLLSSVFVYNCVGRIDSSVIESLSLVTDISKYIHTNATDKSDANFDGFFPYFILAIRDFFLQLKTEDNRILTENQYMEEFVLTSVKNATGKQKKFNEVKKKLRSYFPESKRECFLFPRPVSQEEKLTELENVTEEELQPKFLQKSKEFCDHVYQNSPIKMIDQVKEVNGRMFIQLAELYLSAFSSGSLPCVGSAVEMVAERENNLAIEQSVAMYHEEMSNWLVTPLEEHEFELAHLNNFEKSIKHFLKRSFLDENGEFQEKLRTLLLSRYEDLAEKNVKLSFEFCKQKLEELQRPIKEKMNAGVYMRPGGSEGYFTDLAILKFEYQREPGRGVMASTVWEIFYSECLDQGMTILRADETLSEMEKEKETADLKAAQELAKTRLQEEELEMNKTHQANSEKAHEEEMRLLIEYSEKSSEAKQREYERQLADREREVKRLESEGNQTESARLREEIKRLKAQNNCQKESLVKKIARIACIVGSIALTRMPNPIAKILGLGLGILSSVY